MVATFRCRHELDQARITWIINGTVFRSSPQSVIQSTFITDDNGTVTDILTIPNLPQYDGTQVVCEVSLAGSRVETPVAVLTVIVGGSISIVL